MNLPALNVQPHQSNLPATRETASTAVAAQAKAMIESRYVMALKAPRNEDQSRQNILKECRRPGFAQNKSTLYNKPIGKGVEGLGIRFVEAALRHWRNVLVETTMVYEDEEKEIQRVSVTDLETNTTYPLDVRVSKTVERSKPSDDGSYISVRTNSYNKPVYTVPATDDDLLNKRAALISKAIRTLGLRIIPGDIQDEAEAIIRQIREDDAAADPDAERKRIADAFATIGVPVDALVSYLGHDLGMCSPAELASLRGVYGAIKDGEATWAGVIENQKAQAGEGKGAAAGADSAKTVSDINAAVKAKGAASKKAADAPVAATDTATDAVTYAYVASEIKAAKTADDLDVATDLITAVQNEQQRAELDVEARAKRKQITGAA